MALYNNWAYAFMLGNTVKDCFYDLSKLSSDKYLNIYIKHH